MWQTIDKCFGQRHEHTLRDVAVLRSALIAAQNAISDSQRDRACFNTTRVPHNIEGFFLHFGDVLAKRGK